ncbi:MAG: LexA family protein [Sarcina sp.]
MKFQESQNKFLKNKKAGLQILKGALNTGKTTASIYKAVDLEKNYCIYDSDKVLMLSTKKEDSIKAKEIYNRAKLEMEDSFYSLFSLNDKNQVEFFALKELIDIYFKSYINENKLKLTYGELEKKLLILENIYNEFLKKVKVTTLMKKIDLNYLLEEIQWIKENAFTLEEYLEVNRKGRGKGLRKNSKTREMIYSIKESYSYSIHRAGYMDIYDEVIFAIQSSKKLNLKYAHIILDDLENLTRAEIKFIKYLKNNKYGSFIIINNNNKENLEKSNYLLKGKKLVELLGYEKAKTYLFKDKFNEKKSEKLIFIDKYQYIDLTKGKIVNFEIDNAISESEIIIKDNDDLMVKGTDLKEIPVYSDIAAGEPILINDIIEGKFSLPKNLIGRNENLFMLHVRGDSMIDKNINNGDFVLIKSQGSAYHNEIVAVDIEGSATLKTLNLNGKEPLLMPANTKYEPIKLKGRESNILGVVLGILKNKNMQFSR